MDVLRSVGIVLRRFRDYDGADDNSSEEIIFVIKMVLIIIVLRRFCDYDSADDNSSERILFGL